jgi:hypothetical protein
MNQSDYSAVLLASAMFLVCGIGTLWFLRRVMELRKRKRRTPNHEERSGVRKPR